MPWVAFGAHISGGVRGIRALLRITARPDEPGREPGSVRLANSWVYISARLSVSRVVKAADDLDRRNRCQGTVPDEQFQQRGEVLG